MRSPIIAENTTYTKCFIPSEIALQAIEGASGAKALAHINQIAMEQAKPRSPQN